MKRFFASFAVTCFSVISFMSVADAKPMPKLSESYRVGDQAYVRALAHDKFRNSMWVGTSVGVIEVDAASYDMKNVFTRKDGLANEYVFGLGVDPNTKAVWMGTNAGGASSFNDGKWDVYFPMHGLADYWIYTFTFDHDGKVWIGTWDGASVFDPKTKKFTTYRKELINVWVYGSTVDKTGRVWLGTEGGVTMFNKGQWKSWTHEDGLGAPNADGLPRGENTGLGTRSRHDLSVLASGGENTYNPNYVFAAHYDAKRDLVWFGTWGGGVSSFDGNKTWTSYGVKEGLAGALVYSIAQEEDGALWFGTNKGAVRYDGEKFETFDVSQGLISEHVYAISIDPKGQVWLGTRGGVVRLSYDK